MHPTQARDRTILKASRRLRREMTDAERVLWRVLRNDALGVRFRRQHPIGKAIADFACVEAKIVVEVDGGQHGEERDGARDAALRAAGWLVLRYWNNDVMKNSEGVAEDIVRVVAERMPKGVPPP